jgi:hypothetical protein
MVEIQDCIGRPGADFSDERENLAEARRAGKTPAAAIASQTGK